MGKLMKNAKTATVNAGKLEATNAMLAAESKRLSSRLDNAEAMVRLTTGVQLTQLADAERLRLLALRAVRSSTRGQPADAVDGLRSFARGLKPFVTKTKQLRKALVKFNARAKR